MAASLLLLCGAEEKITWIRGCPPKPDTGHVYIASLQVCDTPPSVRSHDLRPDTFVVYRNEPHTQDLDWGHRGTADCSKQLIRHSQLRKNLKLDSLNTEEKLFRLDSKQNGRRLAEFWGP